MLLEYFKIKSISDAVCGVILQSRLRAETDIIMRAAQKSFETEQRETLVVGDTHFDIDEARTNHKDSTGVLWGSPGNKNLNSLKQELTLLPKSHRILNQIGTGF